MLFDSVLSMIERVGGYVAEGLDAGETVMLALAERKWDAVDGWLQERGISTTRAALDDRLIVVDAEETLRLITIQGKPVATLFDQYVGDRVAALCEGGRRLRLYGEMVDILASRSDFRAALQLESLWNDLAARYAFRLFCGYSSVNFGDARRASALRSICQAHDHSSALPGDALATYLIATHG